MEELYVEILYTIFHMIGCDAEKTDQGALVDHLKEAFHMGLFHLRHWVLYWWFLRTPRF